jgi:hypothetical protein
MENNNHRKNTANSDTYFCIGPEGNTVSVCSLGGGGV